MADDEHVMDPDESGVKPFAAWLVEQRRGGLHGEISDALAGLVAACMEHDKPGTLTLKVSIKPAAGDAVAITDDVTVKAPQADRGAALFFTDARGNLSRRNPRQTELPLRDLSRPDSKPAQDLKEAN